MPPWQLSPFVQALPSLHAVPFGAVGLLHMPVAGLHVPAAWQESLAVQVRAAPPTQAPPWQVSVSVQALPSLQAVPFGSAGFEHMPVVGSQTPAPWHWS